MRRNLPHALLEWNVHKGHGACACAWGRVSSLCGWRVRIHGAECWKDGTRLLKDFSALLRYFGLHPVCKEV